MTPRAAGGRESGGICTAGGALLTVLGSGLTASPPAPWGRGSAGGRPGTPPGSDPRRSTPPARNGHARGKPVADLRPLQPSRLAELPQRPLALHHEMVGVQQHLVLVLAETGELQRHDPLGRGVHHVRRWTPLGSRDGRRKRPGREHPRRKDLREHPLVVDLQPPQARHGGLLAQGSAGRIPSRARPMPRRPLRPTACRRGDDTPRGRSKVSGTFEAGWRPSG
jgi:hypothetical protein